MFPAHLHPHSVMENGDKFVSSIISINNPDAFHIDLKDIERFKRLTGLENLFLDRDAATSIRSYADGTLYDVIVHEAGHGIELSPTGTRFSRKRAEPADRIPRSRHHHVQGSGGSTSRQATDRRLAEDGPALFFLPSRAAKEQLSDLIAATKNGVALTGTAAMEQVGQVVGWSTSVNVTMPTISRYEFSYKIEADGGEVLIKGVTITGERTVYKFSQKFDMLSRNLCPPGQFSISFQLPGPVDPRQLTSNFGDDGILDALIMKSRETTQS
uniref:SHSP domain-containing protein n=1 Tax=Populus alba TaxID=43335 RepID=A0A4U5Q6T2_POPAL|nr:uncharacterized protein D5086_0000145680 [Populus alba]